MYFEGFIQKNNSVLCNAFGEDKISKMLRDWMDSKEVRIAFKEGIKKIIINDIDLDELQIDQLNVLYEILD